VGAVHPGVFRSVGRDLSNFSLRGNMHAPLRHSRLDRSNIGSGNPTWLPRAGDSAPGLARVRFRGLRTRLARSTPTERIDTVPSHRRPLACLGFSLSSCDVSALTRAYRRGYCRRSHDIASRCGTASLEAVVP
jgi:hypothetical protein